MIPFVDLKTQYRSLSREINAAVQEVLDQTNFILGEPVSRFEDEFARFCTARYCVGVASGTDALHLALRALNIGPGDEVITVANTFVASVLAISYVGATPVLVDIDPDTYLIDLKKIEKKITPKTKAILPVHLYGRPVDMTRLMAIARAHNLLVVEDACQSHGASWQGKPTGTFGVIGCFSFYPGKNLGAYGDGGALVTDDQALCDNVKMMRNYGSPKKYYHDFIGYNSRLDTLQAAILRVKLKHVADWNSRRFANARLYSSLLAGVGDVAVPDLDGVESHAFHLYVVRTKKRDELLRYLTAHEVQCGIHYPVPIYRLGAYQALGLSSREFPVTEKFSNEILSLPMFPELTREQITTVTELIKQFFKET